MTPAQTVAMVTISIEEDRYNSEEETVLMFHVLFLCKCGDNKIVTRSKSLFKSWTDFAEISSGSCQLEAEQV